MTVHQPDLNARLGRHYGDIRARLMRGPEKKPVKKTAIAAVIEPVVRARQIPPMWKSGRIHFDAHVVAWQSIFPQQRINALLAENARLREALRISKDDEELLHLPKRPAREIIAEILSKYPGITLRHIKTKRASKTVTVPRDECVVAVHAERSDLSPRQIGDMFGIDRTTVGYIVLKAAAAEGDKAAIQQIKRKKAGAIAWHRKYGRNGKLRIKAAE